jgi:protein KTI12
VSSSRGTPLLCFTDMPREKNLRGLLRSAVDRAVSKDSIVIVDSLNNIKGYRYELWCLARAAGILYCLVFFEIFPFFSDKDFSYS